jgi:hypothetical protein
MHAAPVTERETLVVPKTEGRDEHIEHLERRLGSLAATPSRTAPIVAADFSGLSQEAVQARWDDSGNLTCCNSPWYSCDWARENLEASEQEPFLGSGSRSSRTWAAWEESYEGTSSQDGEIEDEKVEHASGTEECKFQEADSEEEDQD